MATLIERVLEKPSASSMGEPSNATPILSFDLIVARLNNLGPIRITIRSGDLGSVEKTSHDNSITLLALPRLSAMLRNCVVIHQYIALLPFVQDADLIGESSKMSQVLFGYRSTVTVELLRDITPGTIDFGILVVGRQSGEESR